MSQQWYGNPICSPYQAVLAAARERQAQLTKPPGSLGRLEEIGIALAAMQGSQQPRVDHIWISVFAGDHGVTAEGISAFPQVVTAEMVRNFARGGAAISVLAEEWKARLEVVNVGTVQALEDLPGVVEARVGPGTVNFVNGPAMTIEQLEEALMAGHDAAGRAAINGAHLFIGGEMGIGNTTSASAVACSLLAWPASQLAGPGTGLDAAGITRKAHVIERGLTLHRSDQPLVALQRLGGFEIAALAGAYLRCGQLGIPALVDGFIATTAALVAVRLRPELAAWLFYGHCSAEPGHRHLLKTLDVKPLLELGMRLGEGSGAAAAMPLLRAAAVLHARMATFAEAGVSQA
ncbi:MAG: nicotinate-nucleotide--dimethylbenzimidazole phosphoribosyltransferase [Candidatus Competibacteraceae bacterium]|nr:nicotinate-nucleotide--dimethylbenzimidazole phosphoribosyltransferase [Candidatus Competibacteraceae bacterium]